ncbi:nitroreductase family protein [Gordonia sp. HY442]|uniref:nitroreductase family protein n=1 Tax=Gordonia zhenghanii TaxID=2911516 RepID=UPI001F3E44A9|nr:nitroreductase family protein [Gordonia zhenghanii]MCF8603945.1 nitroreductase family protein [Gordonia zhenghanii]
MEYDQVIRTTFAAREFTDDPVTDEALYEVLDTARFAPSGGNRQGAHITIVRDADVKRQIAELSRLGARRYLAQRAAGEMPWNTVDPTTLTEEEIAAARGVGAFVAPLAGAPVLLVVSIDLAVVASTDKDLDRVGVVSGGSIYPLAWNILTAARSRGLGGTFTTMATAEEPAVRELLKIPSGHAVAAVLPLGRPVRQLTRLRRNAVEEFVTRDAYDGAPFTLAPEW